MDGNRTARTDALKKIASPFRHTAAPPAGAERSGHVASLNAAALDAVSALIDEARPAGSPARCALVVGEPGDTPFSARSSEISCLTDREYRLPADFRSFGARHIDPITPLQDLARRPPDANLPRRDRVTVRARRRGRRTAAADRLG